MKMVYTICYALIFLAEILISLFYFENKFERRISEINIKRIFNPRGIILVFPTFANIPFLAAIKSFLPKFIIIL